MIDGLKAFIAVMDDQSLGKAASRLHITQSAVSRRLQQLESSLDGQLFDRGSKPLHPTALAYRIEDGARKLVADAQRLLTLSRQEGAPSGKLRLGMSQATADVLLTAVLADLRDTFPLLDVALKIDWPAALHQSVDAGELDAALMLVPAGATPPPRFAFRRLESSKVVVVRGRTGKARRGSVEMSELAAEQWIVNATGCGFRAALTRSMQATGHDLRIFIESQGLDAQLKLVGTGWGLGILPRSFLELSPRAHDVDVVAIRDFDMRIDLGIEHLHQLGNLTTAIAQVEATVRRAFAAAQEAKRPGRKKTPAA